MRSNQTINYIVTMVSESYVWVGYGETVEDAKQMILDKWREELGDDETTIADIEQDYRMKICDCSDDTGLCFEL